MGSTVHSGEGDSLTATSHQEQEWTSSSLKDSKAHSSHRVVFFRRRASDDSDASLHSFDGSPPDTPPEKCAESELASRVSRLSSGVSFGSNNTDGLPTVLLEGEHEDETEREDDRGVVGFGNLDISKLEGSASPAADASKRNNIYSEASDCHTLGHRHELPYGAPPIPEKAAARSKGNNKKKGEKEKDSSKACTIQ
jgi:hypothetical protein